LGCRGAAAPGAESHLLVANGLLLLLQHSLLLPLCELLGLQPCLFLLQCGVLGAATQCQQQRNVGSCVTYSRPAQDLNLLPSKAQQLEH
jgi:hypothetical protein